jgi:hypothetical protein
MNPSSRSCWARLLRLVGKSFEFVLDRWGVWWGGVLRGVPDQHVAVRIPGALTQPTVDPCREPLQEPNPDYYDHIVQEARLHNNPSSMKEHLKTLYLAKKKREKWKKCYFVYIFPCPDTFSDSRRRPCLVSLGHYSLILQPALFRGQCFINFLHAVHIYFPATIDRKLAKH